MHCRFRFRSFDKLTAAAAAQLTLTHLKLFCSDGCYLCIYGGGAAVFKTHIMMHRLTSLLSSLFAKVCQISLRHCYGRYHADGRAECSRLRSLDERLHTSLYFTFFYFKKWQWKRAAVVYSLRTLRVGVYRLAYVVSCWFVIVLLNMNYSYNMNTVTWSSLSSLIFTKSAVAFVRGIRGPDPQNFGWP